nr:hypothetical protein GCM10010200_030630 [Actinomadura rugatobispora]
MRSTWVDLPHEVRDAVAEQTGLVREVRPVTAGSNAELAAVVDGSVGLTFVKAATISGRQARALRREAEINPHVREFAPRLHWTVETGGWLVLGFEHVEGRHANYAPGSPDLNTVAAFIRELHMLACPDVVEMRVERRWEGLAEDVSVLAGATLLHTDLNPRNFLITRFGRPYVVDWAFASRGAAWIEAGQVIPWLIHAGHSPAEAEAWADQVPAWKLADPAAIDLYAQVSAERWRLHSQANPRPSGEVPEYVTVRERWARHRAR